MAIGNFYTEVVAIAIAASLILYYMARKCTDKVEKLENSPSQEGYIIQSHLWTTDIKDTVEDFSSFIQRNILESKSKDKYIELFSDKEKISLLKNRLSRLVKSYNTYLSFANLLHSLIKEYELSKKWLIRTVIVCFAFASWGAMGFLMETEANSLEVYTNMFWVVFYFLIVLLAIFISKIVIHNRKSGSIKTTMRAERRKYPDIIEKVA